MAREDAKAWYDRQPGEPPTGYVSAADAKNATDQTYDDLEDQFVGVPVALDELTDVVITAPYDGHHLTHLDGGWVNTTLPTATADDVGLGSVDNTSDDAKPVSTLTQAELDAKGDATDVALNTAHRASDGSDHAWLDQPVIIGSSPTFDATNFLNMPAGSAGTDLGWINVQDEGAVGDGTTDDTASIQAALDKAPGVVFFPPGEYLISAPLTPVSLTTIIGSEGASRYWTWADNFPPSACKITVASGFTGNAVWNMPAQTLGVSMQDLTISGENVGSVHGMEWGEGGEHNMNVTRVAIIQMGGDGIRGHIWAGRLNHCFIGGCGGWGLNGTSAFWDLHVTDTFIAGNKLGALAMDGTGTSGLCSFIGVRFERSGFDNWDVNYHSDPDSPGVYIKKAKDIRFVSCDTDANTGHGVHLLSDTGINVENITFAACVFKRDGSGDFTTQPNDAAVRIEGTNGGRVEHVSFTDCTTIKGKSVDGGAAPAYDHPKYGLFASETSHIRVIGGRWQADTLDIYAGGVGFEVTNYRPKMIIPEQGIMGLPQGPTADRPSDPVAGWMFWDRTLDQPIWWGGSSWVDATGTSV